MEDDLKMHGFSLFDIWFDEKGFLQITLDSDKSVELMKIEMSTMNTQENITLQKPTKNSKITKIVRPKKRSTVICGFSDGYLQVFNHFR